MTNNSNFCLMSKTILRNLKIILPEMSGGTSKRRSIKSTRGSLKKWVTMHWANWNISRLSIKPYWKRLNIWSTIVKLWVRTTILWQQEAFSLPKLNQEPTATVSSRQPSSKLHPLMNTWSKTLKTSDNSTKSIKMYFNSERTWLVKFIS